MTKLPRDISGQDIIKALHKIGYRPDYVAGSHIILRNIKEPHRRISVPNHTHVSIGTLRSILQQVGLTREEFLSLL